MVHSRFGKFMGMLLLLLLLLLLFYTFHSFDRSYWLFHYSEVGFYTISNEFIFLLESQSYRVN